MGRIKFTKTSIPAASNMVIDMNSDTSFVEVTTGNAADTNTLTFNNPAEGQILILKNLDDQVVTIDSVAVAQNTAQMFVRTGSVWESLSTPTARRRLGSASSVSSMYSDERLKTEVTDIPSALNKLKKIRGVMFNYIEKPNGFEGQIPASDVRNIGVIAQEIETVLPELVTVDKDGYKSVNYGNLAGFLVQVNKEQQINMEEQQKQIFLMEEQQINMIFAVGILALLVLVLLVVVVWVVLRQEKRHVLTPGKATLL